MGRFAYRAYLDGIRGLAVTVVVFFHAGAIQFREGYLGVDIFFVLSGYLITSIIVREIDSTDKIDIFRFYARRARRILPGAACTLLIVSIIDRIIDPVLVMKHGNCLVAAASYWANFCFIFESTDYWNDQAGLSPIKHYWSLSVEEQYYLVYPFAILIMLKMTHLIRLIRFVKNFPRKVRNLTGNNEIFIPIDESKGEDDERENENGEEDDGKEFILKGEEEEKNLETPISEVGTGSELAEKQETSIQQEEENTVPPISMNLLVRVFMLISLTISCIMSLTFLFVLISYELWSECHMHSFGRVYQLGSGGILAVILQTMSEKRRMCLSCSSTLILRILSFLILCSMLIMLFYPIILPSINIIPAISGMIMNVIIVSLIFLMEGESFNLSDNETQSKSMTRRILSFSPLVYIGKWSYSVYLWHFPLIVFGDELGILPLISKDSSVMGLLRVTIVLIGSLNCGLMSYYLVERVFMKIDIRSKSRRISLSSMGILIPASCMAIIYFLILPNIDSSYFDHKVSMNDVRVTQSFNFTDYYLHYNESKYRNYWFSKRVAGFGDSHCIMAEDKWRVIKRDIGISTTFYDEAGIPPFVPKWKFEKKVRDWKTFFEKMPEEPNEFQPDLLVIYSYKVQTYCLLDRQCNNNFPIPHDMDWDKWEDEWVDAIRSLLVEKLDPSDQVHILWVLPEPWIDLKNGVEVPKECALRLKARNTFKEGDCDIPVNHVKTYNHVVKLLRRIARERGNMRLLNVDSWICEDGVCPIKYQNAFVFMDYNHISREYWILRANDFVQLLADEAKIIFDTR